MKTIWSFVLRNLKRYYRDMGSLFFSLLSVLIVAALYIFFLTDVQVQSIQSAIGDRDAIEPFIHAWVVGGLLCIPAVSVPLILLTFKVDDTAEGVYDDLIVTPVSRIHLMLGYILASWIAGFAMTCLTLLLGEIFIVTKGGVWLPIPSVLKMLGIAGLTILAFSGFSFLSILRLRSHSSLMVINTMLNTLIGFFAGLYVPIGFLSDGVAAVIKAFPLSHSAALLRRVVMKPAMDRLFSQIPVDAADNIRQNYGVDLVLGDHRITDVEMLCILAGFGLLFYIVSAVMLAKTKIR